MQPLTVMVLALVEPGPPAVEDELETLPPPACTCTDDPPAELELDSAPLDAVDPVVPEPDAGAHNDPAGAAELLAEKLRHHLSELQAMPAAERLRLRYDKFRNMAQFYTV